MRYYYVEKKLQVYYVGFNDKCIIILFCTGKCVVKLRTYGGYNILFSSTSQYFILLLHTDPTGVWHHESLGKTLLGKVRHCTI